MRPALATAIYRLPPAKEEAKTRYTENVPRLAQHNPTVMAARVYPLTRIRRSQTLLMSGVAHNHPFAQPPGCGFPIAKIGVLFSLATGAAIALIIDVLNTHDVQLARRLYEILKPNDVLLGDRAFCSYADLVLLKQRQVDADATELSRSELLERYLRGLLCLLPCDQTEAEG